MTSFLASQSLVQISALVILILGAILAFFLTLNYVRLRKASYLFWSAGLWLFALGVLEELLFASGYYNEILIATYLGIVAVLVNLLAIGSMMLVGSRLARNAYYVFSILSALALAVVLATENAGNLLLNYVVAGNPPTLIVVFSSVITFPAAAVLLVTAAMSYMKTKSNKMLSIIAGVVVISVAGSLYIAQFPAFLYYSEFVGILLLWFGFFNIPHRENASAAQPAAT
jgi:hypothetical protein